MQQNIGGIFLGRLVHKKVVLVKKCYRYFIISFTPGKIARYYTTRQKKMYLSLQDKKNKLFLEELFKLSQED